ncbi:single-stranded DNA-binding protein [Thalassospira lucentensis]|uniref:single-stranded DNA-binding protein n=1 Tax=Thalassospira lucentensis TaxID=168935 RepID=UPI0029431EA7|nr:single-stranded DNA-binding protein [Thalassospira lucentensis]WOI09030.1 single-stranded DNA-binding protein [Thalassospira lucentensis]
MEMQMSHPQIEISSPVVWETSIHFTPTGTKVAILPMMTKGRKKNKATGNYEDDLMWHHVRFYGTMAETIEKYIKEGDRNMVVHAELQNRKGADGKYYTNIIGREIVMFPVSGDRIKSLEEAGYQAPAEDPAGSPDLDDEIPF